MNLTYSTHMIDDRFINFSWKIVRIKPLVRRKCRWEETIKMNQTEVGTFKIRSRITNLHATTQHVLQFSDYLLLFLSDSAIIAIYPALFDTLILSTLRQTMVYAALTRNA
jgi:hypothetical protein